MKISIEEAKKQEFANEVFKITYKDEGKIKYMTGWELYIEFGKYAEYVEVGCDNWEYVVKNNFEIVAVDDPIAKVLYGKD